MDGIDVVLDTGTAVLDATGLIVTPGGVDSHVHWLSPQVVRRRARRRPDDARDPGLRPGLEPRLQPAGGPGGHVGGARGARRSTPRCSCAPPRRAPSRSSTSLRAGGAGLKIHEDVGAGPEQIRTALDVADRHDVQLAIHTDGLNEALVGRGHLRGVRRAHGARVPHRGLRRRPRARPARASPAASAAHLLDLADRPVRRPRRARAPGDGRRRPRRSRRAPRRRRRRCAPGCAPLDDGRRGRPARPRRDPDALAPTRRAWAGSARSSAARSRTPPG